VVASWTAAAWLAWSCGYERKVTEKVECTRGSFDDAGTRVVFARWHQRYRRPWGLSRFPDGGQPKMLLDVLDIVVHDLGTGRTRRLARPEAGARAPLDVHVSWKGPHIVYSVENPRELEPEASGIWMISTPDGRHEELVAHGSRPELSPGAGRVAYVEDGSLWVADVQERDAELQYSPRKLELVHVSWDEPGRMELHVRGEEGFEVVGYDLETGAVVPSDEEYARHFGLERLPEGACDVEQ
jgi:hypothetical protein